MRSSRGAAFTGNYIGFRLAQNSSYSLRYTADTGGSLSGDTEQVVLPGADGTTVTAAANVAYVFVGWSDGVTDNPRTDTNVSSGVAATAYFQPDMIPVAAGSFDMGNSGVGDDGSFGNSDELPVHTVTLSAYAIGKFEVTNQQVCDVYNWADDQGLFTTVDATTAQAFGQELLDLDASGCHIAYAAGVFQPESRTGQPSSTEYSMADHPVQEISWFGAVAFCNWLSQMEGLTPVYETSTWTADFANAGYHLPTEAQWERAAAWDGGKHWIYCFTSDTLTGRDRATYNDGSGRVDPLGLTSFPETSPVGWFDGSNVSPNGDIATQDSASPIGAYDMSGNVWEWCHDWYDSGYYASGAATGRDPQGAASGSDRALRGGAWSFTAGYCRSAHRASFTPSSSLFHLGFRLARNTSYSVDYSAGAGGSVSGDLSQTVLPGADGTPVEAMPDTGYTFVDWSDGVTDNPRTDTEVAGGIDVTANFETIVDLPEIIPVAAGSFDMGNTGTGDDWIYGLSRELPVHTVSLSAYGIGKFEVTVQQVCDVYNWANDQGRFTTVNANTATAFGQDLLYLPATATTIRYADGLFQPKTRTGADLAGDPASYSMADHPVQAITWYGAVVYCNWLSEIFGLTPVYDTSTWTADFANDGFHLPTEAQWERAAAWDGAKHWTYGFLSDTLANKEANYDGVNPLGLTTAPYTSPVGWFDGVNVSPNGLLLTPDSVSPVGAYDMSGNIAEWCHDWYDIGYYSVSTATDPRGPASGAWRISRGGAWYVLSRDCRTANRLPYPPSFTYSFVGFRLAKNTSYGLGYTAGTGGSLTGDTSQTVLPGEDGTAVEAVPNARYTFAGWSDGVADNPRIDTTVSSGMAVTANFEPIVEVPELLSVAAGSFDMGNSGAGNDAFYGTSEEFPVHTVSLSAYQIGKFEVTNQQVCDVFNWANDQGLFTTVDASTAQAFGHELLHLNDRCDIEYVDGVFQPKTRTGDPVGATAYSLADHPVQEISWYGAVAYCNWLSEVEALTPVYDTSTWEANFANDGYHLPTEAQWERTAAWGGAKHWIYGITSDSLTGQDRANFRYTSSNYVNPLGLTGEPYTSPAGWFDGANVSPNGEIPTQDSVSPIGAHDMCGNLAEWCHDRYDSGYYSASPASDPEGPATGSKRSTRDGNWGSLRAGCRTAARVQQAPADTEYYLGFRLAR